MAGTTGLEPATSAVTGQRSNQLSYVPPLQVLPLSANCRIYWLSLLSTLSLVCSVSTGYNQTPEETDSMDSKQKPETLSSVTRTRTTKLSPLR
jgi:hypothetical protein